MSMLVLMVLGIQLGSSDCTTAVNVQDLLTACHVHVGLPKHFQDVRALFGIICYV